MCNFEDFEPWAHLSNSQRDLDHEYQAVKEQWKVKLSAELLNYYPHLKPHIKGMTIGTPLTYNTYLNVSRGEVFGLQMGSWRFTPTAFDVLRPSTPIQGISQYLSS